MTAENVTDVDRLGFRRLATAACFGALALGLTACGGTLSGSARGDSTLYVGPPTTIEAALPADPNLASASSAADTSPQSAEPRLDPSAPEEAAGPQAALAGVDVQCVLGVAPESGPGVVPSAGDALGRQQEIGIEPHTPLGQVVPEAAPG